MCTLLLRLGEQAAGWFVRERRKCDRGVGAAGSRTHRAPGAGIASRLQL